MTENESVRWRFPSKLIDLGFDTLAGQTDNSIATQRNIG
jgi:hypothetical protein